MAEHPRHHEPSHTEQAGRTPSSPGTPGTPGSEPYQVRDEPQTYGPSRHDAGSYANPPYERDTGFDWRGIGRRVSWGAIFAGVLVALAIQLLLSVLGIGIGAAAFDPGAPGDPTAWSIGAGVWWVITGLIALFVGGWVAGHLSANPDRGDGALHGIVTWSLATLIGVWMLTSTLGAVTSGAWQVVATGAETAGQQQLQQPAGEVEDLQQQLQDPQQQQQMQQEAQDVADQADEAIAHAGIWTFVAMVLGAAAAGLGGFLATPRNTPANIRQGGHRERSPRS
ncbi:MAG: hypothetical protein WDZ31_01375 [Phycisphaeraceae bacterium]